MSFDPRPTILAGVTGSPASAAALRWAADEAERRRGRLKVVLSWRPEQPAGDLLRLQDLGLQDHTLQQERARQRLAAILREVLGSGPHDNITTQVVEGMAERTLVDCSATAALLVLGSASGFTAGRPVGPVIRACLSRARCPVVVVSPEELALQDRTRHDHPSGPSYHRRDLLHAGCVPAPRTGD